jgi:large subunit ribosomal protein L23
VYAFEVAPRATKFDVRAAVQKLWNVTPVRINIVNRVPRSFVVKAKNRVGTHPGQRKAYVFLKKGDRIDLV